MNRNKSIAVCQEKSEAAQTSAVDRGTMFYSDIQIGGGISTLNLIHPRLAFCDHLAIGDFTNAGLDDLSFCEVVAFC